MKAARHLATEMVVTDYAVVDGVDLAAEVAKAASRWVLTANSAPALVQD